MKPAKGATDQSLVRRTNELSVLRILRSGRVLTSRTVAQESGLSWRTTNLVVETLLARGWLSESEGVDTATKVGRPARHFSFDAHVGHVLGIDVASESITAFVADLAGEIVATARCPVEARVPAPERRRLVFEASQQVLDRAALEWPDIWAATLATSGVVAPDGTVAKSAVLPEWTHSDPAESLRGHLCCPISVANDCNLAAMAERWYGQSSDDLIYLLMGSRLGVGLIIDGRLHRGFSGAAGEIGEIPQIGWDTAAERLAAIERAHGEDVDSAAQRVFASARQGEAAAVRAVETFADRIAQGLTAMVLTIDPELVVLGGSFSDAADVLQPLLDARLSQTSVHKPQIVVSALGDRAVTLGAIREGLDTVDRAMAALPTSETMSPERIQSLLAETCNP